MTAMTDTKHPAEVLACQLESDHDWIREEYATRLASMADAAEMLRTIPALMEHRDAAIEVVAKLLNENYALRMAAAAKFEQTQGAEEIDYVWEPYFETQDALAHLRDVLGQSDSDEELNRAEEVLDSISLDLDMNETGFDSLGDYISAVVSAVKSQHVMHVPVEPQPEMLHIGACITDGKLHATVMRHEHDSHSIQIMATAELDVASLYSRDCIVRMTTVNHINNSDIELLQPKIKMQHSNITPLSDDLKYQIASSFFSDQWLIRVAEGVIDAVEAAHHIGTKQ